jgi:hypothetical protein
MLQKEAVGRGGRRRVGSNQPKPRVERRQMAQGGTGLRMAGHAAWFSGIGCALRTSLRITWRLNWNVSSAEAW